VNYECAIHTPVYAGFCYFVGGVTSPVLANVFAHYVIDEWFYTVVKAHCAGRVQMFRYCDDLLVCCQFERDARRINKALKSRLEKFNLRLNEEKTKLVKFDKRAHQSGNKPESFDLLGLTFYWGRARSGAVIPKMKTIGKRFRSKLRKVNLWCRQVRNIYPLAVIWNSFVRKLAGNIRYYGVSHNIQSVRKFRYLARRLLFKHLNRRSQRRSFNWEKFERYEQYRPVPEARICHVLLQIMILREGFCLEPVA